MNQYDLIVIGAGSGGLVAATTAHRKGLKIALIEKNKIEGECTHYGCVPSKALINAAKAYHSLEKMSDLGISVDVPKPDFGKIMEQVDAIVQEIYSHETPEVFQNQGIDVFVDQSGAQFLDAHTISIGTEILAAKHFVICTGSGPRMPDIEGIEQVEILHNENFWTLRSHPGKVVFIGGGVISVELGQSLARLGCEASIMERNSRILKVTDEEIGTYISRQIEQEGVQIITDASPLNFRDKNTLRYVQKEEEKTITADYFFIAAGRIPHVEGLQLEKAGVSYTSRGITTNEYLQTSAPHIYACGDVTTPFKFTHTASHQANICIDNILEGNTKQNDLSVLPWAIFTEPEIGHVGLSEKEANDKYGDDNISVFKVDANIDRFRTDRKIGGMLKVIFNNKDLVVGAEAVGAHAGEWIQLLTIVIKNKITAQQMADTIFAYPSYSEIVKKAFSRYLRSK
ncbi:MAG: pyruvate/2-oxoglutarate dehydrogenase complex dihydrolipoamide dehydrogenase (E3) component [Saprospiraceae bacterium]|jgi:pyruvate/2-oxoglutarate dehydrogenase complex dihydrolipoamide dehydrogenase (E3) component